MSASSQHTTPVPQQPLGFVTITHPHHPLCGQPVAVLRLRRGANPDLIVRLPDGSHAAIAVSLTDYGNATALPCKRCEAAREAREKVGERMRAVASKDVNRA